MATAGTWKGTDTYDGGVYYSTKGLSSDTLEFRTGYEPGASTAQCSRPTSIWKNGVFQSRYGCNWPGNLTFAFTPNPSVSYDCINGACIAKTTYNTPGIHQSLSDCEVTCGTGCSGKCLSNSEWASIEGLGNQLKSTNCS